MTDSFASFLALMQEKKQKKIKASGMPAKLTGYILEMAETPAKLAGYVIGEVEIYCALASSFFDCCF